MFDGPEWRQEFGPHGVQKVFPPAPLQRADPLAAPLDVVLHHQLPVRTVVLVRYPRIGGYIVLYSVSHLLLYWVGFALDIECPAVCLIQIIKLSQCFVCLLFTKPPPVSNSLTEA